MRDIVVKKYKGDRALQRGLNDMAKKGYAVDQQASRKALYSATAGVFTRKQIHTVTFRKQPADTAAAVTSPAARSAASPPSPVLSPPPTVNVIDQLERLGKLRDSAVLTQEEFEAQKAALLAGSSGSAPTPAGLTDAYEVVVAGLGPSVDKIAAIKAVRAVGGLDLASAKDIVDYAAGEPTVLRSGVSRADADSFKSGLESAGLVVEIGPDSRGD